MNVTNLRNRHFLAWDVLLLAATPFLAYAIRFEGFVWGGADVPTSIVYACVSLPLKIAIFVAFGLYGRLWRHATVSDMGTIVRATAMSASACVLLGIFALPYSSVTAVRVPISVVILDAFLTGLVVVGPRLGIKSLGTWYRRADAGARRALIAGAGSGGEMVLREILANPILGLVPVGFVDDDPAKLNQRLGGMPVLGRLSDIPAIVAREQIDEVIIAMPRASGSVVRSVVRSAAEAKVTAKTVPGLSEIVSGRVKVSALRKVEIQDVLRREAVTTDRAAIRDLVVDRTVLITGAGGSIGSELARQVVELGPRRLLLLGNSENEIFEIEEELQRTSPTVALVSVIADVRDAGRLRSVFATYLPHMVFHAAAHKHVPLMEYNVAEAVTNNVLGTRNVLDCAVLSNVDRLVFVSTDKAVRPVNVMGATKRAAEMMVQHAAACHGKNFVAVRFGNVLGSRGSVVPTFMRQIRAGGPITITHPEMRRFFMTIPEAVQLVLQAAALGRGGEVFALDMGEPVRIVDLAADLIRLSGLEVGSDIEIKFSGIRAGERLHEEVFFQGEDVIPTAHPKILQSVNGHPPEDLLGRIDTLIDAARRYTRDEEVRPVLQWVVPEFRPEEHGGSLTLPLMFGRGASPRPTRDGDTDRRLSQDRRGAPDRRANTESRRRHVRLHTDDRRNGRDRRSGIDRRTDIFADAPRQANAV